MEKYLIDLIKNNVRVIVPDFGAFIISGEHGNTVNFNGFLKFNDGMLIGHISNEEGIGSVEATKKVEEFVENINFALNNGKPFSIEGLGTFSKELSGAVKFFQINNDEHIKKEEHIKKGEQIISKPEINIAKKDSSLEDTDELLDIGIIEESNISETIVTKSMDVSKSEEKQKPAEIPIPVMPPKPATVIKTAEPPKLTQPPKPVDVKVTSEPPKLTEPLKPVDTIKPSEPPKPVIPTKPVEKSKPAENQVISNPVITQKKADIQKTENNDKKFPIGILILIIVVLLFVAAGCYFHFFTDIKFPFYNYKKQIEIPIIEEPAIKETPVVEEIPQIIETVAEKPIITFPQHHIIIGSFKEKWRAEKLLEKMHEKGYSQAHIFERNGFFMVSVECYSSGNKAFIRQEELLNELRMDNWILSLRK